MEVLTNIAVPCTMCIFRNNEEQCPTGQRCINCITLKTPDPNCISTNECRISMAGEIKKCRHYEPRGWDL